MISIEMYTLLILCSFSRFDDTNILRKYVFVGIRNGQRQIALAIRGEAKCKRRII